MSTSKYDGHTPEPWWAGSDDDSHLVYAGDSEFVADTSRDDGDLNAEAANARLIADAPKLLRQRDDLLTAMESIMYLLREADLGARSVRKGDVSVIAEQAIAGAREGT